MTNNPNEIPEVLKPRVQRPSSKEELGALLEGDVLVSNVGWLLYTEKYGDRRLIRQLNSSEVLSVHIKEDKRHKYQVLENGTVEVISGDRISVFHNWDWIQYSLDQSLIKKAGGYNQA